MISEKTTTTIFIVPTLGISRKSLFDNNFINGYIDYTNKDLFYTDDIIYLLFKPKNLDLFKHFLEEEYERTENILEDFDIEHDYVISVYKTPDIFKSDIALIKESKYSKTSKNFQNFFPKKVIAYKKGVNSSKNLSLQHRIFNKDPILLNLWEDLLDTELISTGDLEIWPKFEIETETLNINNLKT